MNRLAITIIYIFLSACASQPEPFKSPDINAAKAKDAPPQMCPDSDKVKVGHTRNGVGVDPLKAHQENQIPVEQKYACKKNYSPYVVIERNELYISKPKDSELKVHAGETFTHCFIYTVCDSDSSSKPNIKANLTREVLGGKKPLKDTSKNIEIKSGRWTDVARITLPPMTPSKDYIFKLSFSFLDTKIIRDLPFEILKSDTKKFKK